MQKNISLVDLFSSTLLNLFENYLPHLYQFFEEVDRYVQDNPGQESAHQACLIMFNNFPRKDREYKNMIKTLTDISKVNSDSIIECLSKMVKTTIKKSFNEVFSKIGHFAPFYNQTVSTPFHQEITDFFVLLFLSDLMTQIVANASKLSKNAMNSLMCLSHLIKEKNPYQSILYNKILLQWATIYSIISEQDFPTVSQFFDFFTNDEDLSVAFSLFQFVRLDADDGYGCIFMNKILSILQGFKKKQFTCSILSSLSYMAFSIKYSNQLLSQLFDIIYPLRLDKSLSNAVCPLLTILMTSLPKHNSKLRSFLFKYVLSNLNDKTKLPYSLKAFQFYMFGHNADPKWLFWGYGKNPRCSKYTFFEWNSQIMIPQYSRNSFTSLFMNYFFQKADFLVCPSLFSNILAHLASLDFAYFTEAVLPSFLNLQKDDPRLWTFLKTVTQINSSGFLKYALTSDFKLDSYNLFNQKIDDFEEISPEGNNEFFDQEMVDKEKPPKLRHITQDQIDRFNEIIRPFAILHLPMYQNSVTLPSVFLSNIEALTDSATANADSNVTSVLEEWKITEIEAVSKKFRHSKQNQSPFDFYTRLFKILPYVLLEDDLKHHGLMNIMIQLSSHSNFKISSNAYKFCIEKFTKPNLIVDFLKTLLPHISSPISPESTAICISLLEKTFSQLKIPISEDLINEIDYSTLVCLSSDYVNIRSMIFRLRFAMNTALKQQIGSFLSKGLIELIEKRIKQKLFMDLLPPSPMHSFLPPGKIFFMDICYSHYHKLWVIFLSELSQILFEFHRESLLKKVRDYLKSYITYILTINNSSQTKSDHDYSLSSVDMALFIFFINSYCEPKLFSTIPPIYSNNEQICKSILFFHETHLDSASINDLESISSFNAETQDTTKLEPKHKKHHHKKHSSKKVKIVSDEKDIPIKHSNSDPNLTNTEPIPKTISFNISKEETTNKATKSFIREVESDSESSDISSQVNTLKHVSNSESSEFNDEIKKKSYSLTNLNQYDASNNIGKTGEDIFNKGQMKMPQLFQSVSNSKTETKLISSQSFSKNLTENKIKKRRWFSFLKIKPSKPKKSITKIPESDLSDECFQKKQIQDEIDSIFKTIDDFKLFSETWRNPQIEMKIFGKPGSEEAADFQSIVYRVIVLLMRKQNPQIDKCLFSALTYVHLSHFSVIVCAFNECSKNQIPLAASTLAAILRSNSLPTKMIWDNRIQIFQFVSLFFPLFINMNINTPRTVEFNPEIEEIIAKPESQKLIKCFCIILSIVSTSGPISEEDFHLSSRQLVFHYLANWSLTKSANLSNLREFTFNALSSIVTIGTIFTNNFPLHRSIEELFVSFEIHGHSILSSILRNHLSFLLSFFISLCYSSSHAHSDLIFSAIISVITPENSTKLTPYTGQLVLLLSIYIQLKHLAAPYFFEKFIHAIKPYSEIPFQKTSLVKSPSFEIKRPKLSPIKSHYADKVPKRSPENQFANSDHSEDDIEMVKDNQESNIEYLCKHYFYVIEVLLNEFFNIFLDSNLHISLSDITESIRPWIRMVRLLPKQSSIIISEHEIPSEYKIFTPYQFLQKMLEVTEKASDEQSSKLMILWRDLFQNNDNCYIIPPFLSKNSSLKIKFLFFQKIFAIRTLMGFDNYGFLYSFQYHYFYFINGNQDSTESQIAEFAAIQIIQKNWKQARKDLSKIIHFLIIFNLEFQDKPNHFSNFLPDNGLDIFFHDIGIQDFSNPLELMCKKLGISSINADTLVEGTTLLSSLLSSEEKAGWGNEALKWIFGCSDLNIVVNSLIIYNQLLTPLDDTVISSICRTVQFHIQKYYRFSKKIETKDLTLNDFPSHYFTKSSTLQTDIENCESIQTDYLKILNKFLKQVFIFFEQIFNLGYEKICFDFVSSFLDCMLFSGDSLIYSINVMRKALNNPQTSKDALAILPAIIRQIIPLLEHDFEIEAYVNSLIDKTHSEYLMAIVAPIKRGKPNFFMASEPVDFFLPKASPTILIEALNTYPLMINTASRTVLDAILEIDAYIIRRLGRSANYNQGSGLIWGYHVALHSLSRCPHSVSLLQAISENIPQIIEKPITMHNDYERSLDEVIRALDHVVPKDKSPYITITDCQSYKDVTRFLTMEDEGKPAQILPFSPMFEMVEAMAKVSNKKKQAPGKRNASLNVMQPKINDRDLSLIYWNFESSMQPLIHPKQLIFVEKKQNSSVNYELNITPDMFLSYEIID